MKIKHVSYLGSYACDQPFPEGVGSEFAVVGRSNVGKSSLINTMVGRHNIARTSNTPGKTRTANFYPVNDRFCFVDLPGYGYAQVSKSERARWARLIESYLAERAALIGVIHLLDVRHAPSAGDQQTSAELRHSGKRVCVVFNKIDKIKRGQVNSRISTHLHALDLDERTAVVPFSAETGEGKGAVWAWIQAMLSL
ncbi:MAG: ribosome biogenesis GTP-binding protein YihA/YsxC [Candidatus Krumholzibacteria bacterium]